MAKKLYRYHDEVYMPDNKDALVRVFKDTVSNSGALTFSLHAVDKIIKAVNMYGISMWSQFLQLIRSGNILSARVFEIYINSDGEITKACFRAELEGIPVDLTLVISAKGVIITAYTTNREDNHKTFNKSLYCTE